MLTRTLASLTLLAASSTALAAADLATAVIVPAPTMVYTSSTWQVQVTNVGNQTANGVSVTVQLPETHTSPQVYVMGTLGTYSSSCTRANTVLTCSLGTLKRGKSATVSFALTLPESEASIDVSAHASTTSYEPIQGNNDDTESAAQLFRDVSFTGDRDVHNDHCTGTGLTAWWECTLFPGAISSHDATFVAGGAITFPPTVDPGYGGWWYQPTSDTLAFVYTYLGDVVAEFNGSGTQTDACWEGLTTFNGSSYVAPYKVCLQ